MPIEVSVVIPCYNEEQTIHLLLEALLAQTFPLHAMEVIIADGLSTDRTRQQIANFAQAHPEMCIRVVDNPARAIPAGVNRAIQSARGEIIMRLDAHSAPHPEYVRRCVDGLQQGQGDNVGGVWEIRPGNASWQARSIAAAAAHPFGVGDAHYRHAEHAQAVDTVPFGAFYRQLVERVGFFDETLLTNEDYEFNVRIRQAGGTIWLDPAIRCVYFARPTLGALARQYWRYGYWKVRMLRRYPQTLRWRQALPPLFVVSLFLLPLLSIFWPILWALFVIELVIYILLLLLAGIQGSRKQRDSGLIIGVPLAIMVMHLAWGSAFLWSLIA